MIITSRLSKIPSSVGPLHLALGFFDGVHLGHREVIRHAQQQADMNGGMAVVVTFAPHPLSVLRPAEAPRLLMSTAHRASIINRTGVGAMVSLPFTRETASLSPEEFVASLTNTPAGVGTIAVGEAWAFGRGRSGNIQTLINLGRQYGFQAIGVRPVIMDGEPVSSTRLRTTVEAGNLVQAARLLGRDYSLMGTVLHGKQLGRTLGFPTANLTLEVDLLPPLGVYAVRAVTADRLVDGVANLGVRPTVDGDGMTRHFEIHLFDFSGDLYGQSLEVRLVHYLRGEQKFASLDALQNQIAQDCARAKFVLTDQSSL